MSYAIIRFEKVKAEQLKGVDHHNRRRSVPTNADPEMTEHNRSLVGPGAEVNLSDLVYERIAKAGAKTRTNSVVAEQVVLTASPEFFRPNDPDRINQERSEQWAAKATEWLQEQFGDRVVDAQLHYDETTPHIHALVVPLTSDNRLSAKEVFCPKTLRQYQTNYANSMKEFGLERGIQGSKRKHQRVKDYYKNIAAGEQGHIKIKAPKDPGTDLEKWSGVVTKQVQKSYQPALDKAANHDAMKRERDELEATAKAAQQQLEKTERSAKELAAQFRDVPLDAVLEKLGAADRVVVNGHRWHDPATGVKGGKAIDLVKQVGGLDFEQSVAWLAAKFGDERAAAAVRSSAAETVAEARSKHPKPTPEVAPAPTSMPTPAAMPAAMQQRAAASMIRGRKAPTEPPRQADEPDDDHTPAPNGF